MNVLSVNVFVTSECNMRCVYCYESPKSREQMSENVVDRFVGYICNSIVANGLDIVKIQFHGGEPLLALPTIKKIISQINEKKNSKCKIITGLTTNGTVMTDDTLSFISDEIDLISISIDGKKDSHDANRRMVGNRDSYELVLENAVALLCKYPSLVARMTVAKNTLHNVAENIIDLIERGFKIISPELDFIEDSWTEEDIRLYCCELESVYRYIQRHNIDVTVTTFESTEKAKKGSKCLGGTNSISVDVNGKIYPCMLVVGEEEWIIGNIFTGVDKKFTNYLKSVTDKDNSACEGCARIEYCEGNRCKIINKHYTGDYYIPFPAFCANENIGFHLCQIKNKKERRIANVKD